MDRIRFGFSLPADVREIGSQAREAEELGFDFVGLGEHLMMGNPPSSSALSLAALGVAAGATTRIELLSNVILLPVYPPVILAKLVTTLDQASGGRYMFGVGVGGEFADDFRAAGVPVRERGARANEMLRLLRLLWTQEHVSFHGKFYHADDVTINPGPLQKPYPPIWVAGRQEAAMRRAARYGDGWLPYMYNPGRYRRSVAKITEIAAATGRDLSGFTWGCHQYVIVGDSAEAALEAGVATFPYSAGRDPAAIIKDYWLYGNPDDVARGLEAVIEAGARVISFIAPGREPDEIMGQARRIAREVIPRFRGVTA